MTLKSKIREIIEGVRRSYGDPQPKQGKVIYSPEATTAILQAFRDVVHEKNKIRQLATDYKYQATVAKLIGYNQAIDELHKRIGRE